MTESGSETTNLSNIHFNETVNYALKSIAVLPTNQTLSNKFPQLNFMCIEHT
jgi:hypothetical protein